MQSQPEKPTRSFDHFQEIIHMLRVGVTASLVFGLGLLIWFGGQSAHGQTTPSKKKTTANKTSPKSATKSSKKAKGGAAADNEPANPLEELNFGAGPVALPEDGSMVDLDETPDGKRRLEDLQQRAREIFKERDKVDRQRRPLAIPRDRLLGEVALLNQGIANAQQIIQQSQNAIRNLQRLQNNGQDTQATQDAISNQQNQMRLANDVIATNQDQISERATEITALNLQIEPLDQRLFKLWTELNGCRKQWLEIRQPQLKYAYGHFESLKRVIDDWVLLDGLWPDAFCWAALCNYELGNYEAAWENVEQAAELRTTLRFPKAWAQGEALRGLIAAQMRERRNKSAGFLQAASLFAAKDKNTNWETHFLIGRASFDNDKTAAKAKASFEKALKIQPDAACVQYWNARLQTTSTVPAVRDVEQGTKTLETLWQRSTKTSWRLSHALVVAYDAYDQEAKSKELWDITLQLAPPTEHQRLIESRKALSGKFGELTTGNSAPQGDDAKEEKPKSPPKPVTSRTQRTLP